jgi:heat shock protein HslJ
MESSVKRVLMPTLLLTLLFGFACRATAPDWSSVTDREWIVTDTEAGPATLTFGPEGRLSGKALNSFFAEFEQSDDALQIGAIGATRMAGSPEAMAAERELFERLVSVTGWRTSDGRLELLGADGVLLQLESD